MSRPKVTWPLSKIVEVTWLDSASTGGWDTPKDLCRKATPLTCRSVGYLLDRTRRGISLMQSQGVSGQVADSIAIPKGCILSVRRLKAGTK